LGVGDVPEPPWTARVVRTATGPEHPPRGQRGSRDQGRGTRRPRGQTGGDPFVDRATGRLGHSIYSSVLTAAAPSPTADPPARLHHAIKPLLNLPAKMRGGPQVTLLVDGRAELSFDIRRADSRPDWWPSSMSAAWRGKTLTLQVTNSPSIVGAAHSHAHGDCDHGRTISFASGSARSFHSSRDGAEQRPQRWSTNLRCDTLCSTSNNPYVLGMGQMHLGPRGHPHLVRGWRLRRLAFAPDEFGRCSAARLWWNRDTTSGLFEMAGPPLGSSTPPRPTGGAMPLAYSNRRPYVHLRGQSRGWPAPIRRHRDPQGLSGTSRRGDG